MYSIVFASNPKSEFNGTLSILGPNTESNSRTLGLNLRYIPLVKFDISSLCDAEVSGNIFTTFDSNNIVDENLIEQNFKSDYYQETIVGDETYSKRTFGYLIARFSPYYYDKI